MEMFKQFRPALLLLAAMTILTGIIYPLAVTAVAQVFFPHQANGSLIMKDGKALGSQLIGQQFDDPKYFWGRLSATAPAFNAGASSGSNYGPLNPALKEAAVARIAALKTADPGAGAEVPVDLVTASGSGLDPHVSIAAIEYQLARVARVRGLKIDDLRTVVARHTQDRQLGILGESRVNVLELNLELDGRLDAKLPRLWKDPL
jgi:K+-transporting ATPase ATPase C chain